MNELCHLYWKPVYAFIRNSRHVSNEDAKDLTQAFFEELLERNFFDRAAPELGSFRSYLRGAVHRFLLKQHERGAALKRGGGKKLLPLDDARLELDIPEDGQGLSAEDVFDRQWGKDLIDQALEVLREELHRSDKLLHFRVFERYALDPPAEEATSYAKVAAEFGLSESDIGHYLAFCRKRIREILTDRIRDYVTNEREVTGEFSRILALFGSVRS